MDPSYCFVPSPMYGYYLYMVNLNVALSKIFNSKSVFEFEFSLARKPLPCSSSKLKPLPHLLLAMLELLLFRGEARSILK
jgi:hypothetical protein